MRAAFAEQVQACAAAAEHEPDEVADQGALDVAHGLAYGIADRADAGAYAGADNAGTLGFAHDVAHGLAHGIADEVADGRAVRVADAAGELTLPDARADHRVPDARADAGHAGADGVPVHAVP